MPKTGRDQPPTGHVGGYLALGLVTLLFTIPYLPLSLAPYKEPLGLAVLILVLVFGLKGIRLGRGQERFAAWLAVVVLSFTMLACVAIDTYRSIVEMSQGMKAGR